MLFEKIQKLYLACVHTVKQLGKYDQYRIDVSVNDLRQSKLGIYFMNVFVFAVLLKIKLAAIARQYFSAKNKQDSLEHLWDACVPARMLRENPRVLIVAEMLNVQCRTYRVEQKLQQFQRLGWQCEVVPWQQLVEAKKKAFFYDMVIFFRVLGIPKVITLIDYIRSLNKVVIFDVDDLIFDKPLLEEEYANSAELLSDEVKNGNLFAADLYKEAILHCDYAITSTSTLQKQLAELVLRKHCFLLPNAITQQSYTVQSLPESNKNSDDILLLYGSGSPTHEDDFQNVVAALVRLMQRHSHVKMVILGDLKLPSAFDDYAQQIIRVPLMDFESYLLFLRQSDISIAPLQSGIFSDAKSEIKWLEAAVFAVPTVMSPTKTYQEVVQDTQSGFFASSEEQWYCALNALIEDAGLRQRVGETARAIAMEKYGEDAMQNAMRSIIHSIQEQSLASGRLTTVKKTVLLVTSFYAPCYNAHDPLCRIRRFVEQCKQQYNSEFEIIVLTADTPSGGKYELREYGLNGVRVIALGFGKTSNLLHDYKNTRIEKTVQDIYESCRPDLIHFHEIADLSAVPVQVARDMNIPFVVSVYDDWWLGKPKERVLSINVKKQTELHTQASINPFRLLQQPKSLAKQVSRVRYMLELLNHAEKIIVASQYHSAILQENGIETVLLPEGIMLAQPPKAKLHPTLQIGLMDLHGSEQRTLQALEVIQNSVQTEFSLHCFSDSESVAQQCRQNLGASVHSHWPQLNNMSAFIANLDILMVTAENEEYSDLIVRECYANHTYVIAPKMGVFSHTHISNESITLYDTLDSANIKPAIQRVMEEKNARTDSTEKTLLLDSFSISDYTGKMLNYYTDIINANNTR